MAAETKITPDNPQGVALKIYRPTPENHRLKALIYGDPGVGKTTLAATAMNHSSTADVLIVNIEGGIMSVVGASEVGLHKTPDVIDLGGWKELEGIFWFLHNGEHNYQTLVIDSLSELTQMNLDQVVEDAIAKSRGDKKRTDPDLIQLDDHGKSAQQMIRVIRSFRDLPMHVIFTCHAASEQDKEKSESVHPALPPKLRRSVLGYMDVVGYMYTQEEPIEGKDGETILNRKLLTQPYGKWIAKDRSPGGRLGVTLTNPTIPDMINRINNVQGDS